MQRGTTTLLDALDMFHLDCEARRLIPSTRQFYTAKLSVFIKWCQDNQAQALETLTATTIRRFWVHIQRRQLSSQYQHNLARAIRAFLNYCVRDELLDRSPFDRVQMPKLGKKVPQALTPSDINAVLRGCTNDRDTAICLFLLDSGVRASELIALDIGDIDLKTGAILVSDLGDGAIDGEVARTLRRRGLQMPCLPAHLCHHLSAQRHEHLCAGKVDGAYRHHGAAPVPGYSGE